ncbi:hypothetical protein MRX96_025539 [Rhipicephalus microplus]
MTFAIVAVLLGSLGGGGETPVQFLPMLRCDSNHTAEIMRVTTKDAVGHIVPCIDGFGSCTHDFCNTNKNTTMLLGNGTEPDYGVQCPVRPGTYYRTLDFKLSPKLIKHIGNGELLGTMQLESRRKVVACHAYYMMLYPKRPTAKEWY